MIRWIRETIKPELRCFRLKHAPRYEDIVTREPAPDVILTADDGAQIILKPHNIVAIRRRMVCVVCGVVAMPWTDFKIRPEVKS